MKYFFDTEFIEDGRTIDLISIGIVSEDGRELYLCSTEARLDLANDWVRANVLPKLPPYNDGAWKPRTAIKQNVFNFVNPLGNIDLGSVGDKPEFWAYYADYDWVAFCQLFGRMIDLPKGFPMWCRDLKQLSEARGNPKHPPLNPGTEHNALEDARWNRKLYEFLMF